MAVRYMSFATRKQVDKRREAELRSSRTATAFLPSAPSEALFAEGLLPTVEGYVHGVVSLDPPSIQCDGCGHIATGERLATVALTSGILFTLGDPRRLCAECRNPISVRSSSEADRPSVRTSTPEGAAPSGSNPNP